MLLQSTTRYLYLSIICACLSALALVAIPICDAFGEKAEEILSLAVAMLFWGSLLLEQCFFWMADSGRKMIQKRAFGGRLIVKPSLGIITFGANKEARLFDTLLAVSIVAIIILIASQVQSGWLVTPVLALLLLSIIFHCIFNGTTYRYIKAFQKIKKEPKNYENTRNAN